MAVVGVVGGGNGVWRGVACVFDGDGAGVPEPRVETQLPWFPPLMAAPVGLVPLIGGIIVGAPTHLPQSRVFVAPGECASSLSLPPWRHRLRRPWPSHMSFCRVELPCQRRSRG